MFEVQGKMVPVEGLDVDVGAGGHFGGAEEELDEAAAGELVCDVIEVRDLYLFGG